VKELSRPLDIGLDQIKTLLLKMGNIVKDSLTLSLKGFLEKEDVHVQIRSWSNTLLILSEEVEDRATELIALYQPMAVDLRTLKAYIKIAYNMERYGRYCMDISDIFHRFGEWPPYPRDDLRIADLGDKVKDVVDYSLRLIETMDESLIWELSKKEAETDELYVECLCLLADCSDCDTMTIVANLLTIRYLERIADHASYIAESITYATTGKRITLR
jgi:phosphate transport system protein